MHPVYIIGTELGSYTLAEAHVPLVSEAEVLAGGVELIARWGGLCPKAIRLELGGPCAMPYTHVQTAILHAVQQGKHVVVLADGDPLYFGMASSLLRALPPEQLRILPGISALQIVAARLGLAWSSIHSVSLHGRRPYTQWASLAAGLLGEQPVCILGDAKNGPRDVARWMAERGCQPYTLHLFEALNSAHEKHTSMSLEAATTLPESFSCAAPTMLLVPQPRASSPNPFISNPPQTDGDLLTKSTVRAVAVASLGIRPDAIVWDIGSGSGSVAFAAAHCAPRGTVYAIEQHEHRSVMIQKNRRSFNAYNVECLTANAPDGLETLPDPDAIFIGGGLGGKNREALLAALATRLKPGGRLVAACVLLGSVQCVQHFASKEGWTQSITLVQACESVALAGDVRLEAHNPVHLVCLEKPVPNEPA